MDSRNRQKTICFDLDGTLCTNTFGDYEAAEPLPWAIARVNALAEAGHRIIVFTARGTATGIDWDSVTRGQLERWGVRYDELQFGKPSADVYVDDRGVHTDAWHAGDAFGVPGGPEELPAVPPAALSTVVEYGRTYSGEPLRLEAHADRALIAAAAAGIAVMQSKAEVVEAVREALPDEDVVYAIAISAPGHAAQLDLPPVPAVSVTCRPLAEATTTNASGDWPLRIAPDGTLSDSLGGLLAVVRDEKIVVEPAPRASVALAWLRDLAPRCGLSLVEFPLREADLRDADEVFVAGIPYCIAPVGSEPGPVVSALLEAWSAEAGVDLLGVSTHA
jgi:branched-subunit amino acid aminotransferase/4-amino-4-deoxychorismate lyase